MRCQGDVRSKCAGYVVSVGPDMASLTAIEPELCQHVRDQQNGESEGDVRGDFENLVHSVPRCGGKETDKLSALINIVAVLVPDAARYRKLACVFQA